MEDNKSKLDDIVQLFIDKYGEEELYTKDLYNKVTKWLDNTDDIEIKEILLELFSDFKFYTKIEIKSILYKQITESLKKVNINTTNIVPLTSKDGRSNSSFDMIQLIKELDKEHNLGLYRDTIVSDVNYIESDVNDIIIFDDISGTGKTVIDFLTENYHIFIGKRVHLNLLSITNTAKIAIETFLLQQKDYNIELCCNDEYEKIFINHPILKEKHQKSLMEFEKEIWGRPSNLLGYQDSQLLIGYSHNIPNNTISSFWYHPDFGGKLKEWNSLFRRYTNKKRPKNSSQNRLYAKSKKR